MSVVIDLWRQAPWWRRTTLIALVCTVLAFAPSRHTPRPLPGAAAPIDAAKTATAETGIGSTAPHTVAVPPATPTASTGATQAPDAYRAPAGSGALTPSRNLRVQDLPPSPVPKDDTPVYTGRDPRLLPSRPTTPTTDPKATDNP